MKRIKSVDIQRELPGWAKVVKTINDTDVYDMDIFENIMSWNQNNLDTAALDYFGNIITYRQLPDLVNEYVCGFEAIGITEKDIVTLCLPVSVENMISLFALDHIGAISNNVNYLFMKSDFDIYTRQKGSRTLVTLDTYLPSFVDNLEDSGIETVILTSLTDYLPENNKHVFDDKSKLTKKLKEIFDDPVRIEQCREKVSKIRNVRFLTMSDVIKIGKDNLKPFEHHPVDVERDISYSYTSGTTNDKPKCIVYKEYSANALIELHNGIDNQDYVGQRVYQVIPYTHSIGERFCGYLQLARGKTIVPQPIYNKESFAFDLVRTQCSWVTAAPSFYLAGVQHGFIASDAFSHLERPCAGGEAISMTNVQQIDEWLKQNGCPTRLAIGGGAAEDGSSTLVSYFMNIETKKNETGMPIEPGILAKIVDRDGKTVPAGSRGYLEISSAAAADRYLDDPTATKKRWYFDENGIRWGKTGDIAICNEQGIYTILGRGDDVCKDSNGNLIYLFDIENQLDINDPISEWEITAFSDSSGKDHIVAQVVKKDSAEENAEVIRLLCLKYSIEAVKIYDRFGSSDVTGKRDYKKLKEDRNKYYTYRDNYFYEINYTENEQPAMTEIDSCMVSTCEF